MVKYSKHVELIILKNVHTIIHVYVIPEHVVTLTLVNQHKSTPNNKANAILPPAIVNTDSL